MYKGFQFIKINRHVVGFLNTNEIFYNPKTSNTELIVNF